MQKEADGRLYMHAAHATGEEYKAVVMCLALKENIKATLFQKCGTRTRTRILHIGNIVATVSRYVCKALIGKHAYTGCDTLGAFVFAKGRQMFLKY